MRQSRYNTSRDTGSNAAAPRKGGSTMLTGAAIGILIGVGIAAGLAWYMMKSPSPFLSKAQQPVNPPVAVQPPAATDAKTATPPAVDDKNGKPRFEFYKVLTDKNADSAVANKHTEKTKPAEKMVAHAESKPVAGYEPQILQVGSFSNTNEAEKLKAKLALLGVEAYVQTAAIPDKGVWFRVRLGPYKSEDDMKHARNFLKQNGVESTPMHAQ